MFKDQRSKTAPSGWRVIIQWEFFKFISFMVGFDCRKIPNSFLMVPNIGVRFKEIFLQVPETLHKLSKYKVNPSDFASNKIFPFQ